MVRQIKRINKMPESHQINNHYFSGRKRGMHLLHEMCSYR